MGELDKEEVQEAAINIAVKDQAGIETQFKIKKETKIEKVMAAYAAKQGIEQSSFRFFFDGKAVQKELTGNLRMVINLT